MAVRQYYTKPGEAMAGFGVPRKNLRFLTGLGYYAGAPPQTPAWKKTQQQKLAAANKPLTVNDLIKQYQGTFLTPAQQHAAAVRDVNAEIGQSITGMNAQSQAERAAAKAAADRAQNYALALAKINQGDPEQVAAQYRASANAIQGYGAGLSGAVEASQKAQADEAAAAIAQQTGGLGVLRQAVDPAAARVNNVLTSATMPATTLQEEAANAYTTAVAANKAEPAALARVRDQYIAKGLQERTNLANQVTALQKTRPDLYAKAVAAYRDANRQDMASIITALTLQSQTENIQSQIANRKVTGAAATTRAGAATTTAQTGQYKVTGLDKNGNLLPGFYYPNALAEQRKRPQKVPASMHVDPKNPNNLIPNVKPKGPNPATTTKSIQATINSVRKTVVDAAKSAAYTRNAAPYAPTPVWVPVKKWQEAVNGLLTYFPKKFRKDSRVLQLIYDQLESVGYQNPVKTSKNPAVNPNAQGPIDVRPGK